jgi:hypothetical protein
MKASETRHAAEIVVAFGWGLPHICLKCGARDAIAWRLVSGTHVPVCAPCDRRWRRWRLGAVLAVVLSFGAGAFGAAAALTAQAQRDVHAIAALGCAATAFMLAAGARRGTLRARRRRGGVVVLRGVHPEASEAWRALTRSQERATGRRDDWGAGAPAP